MKKIALVGCGRIAKRHSEILSKKQIRGARLVAVCDINKKKSQELGNIHNVSSYSDMDEMMQNEDIDIPVVLTPSGLHAEHILNLAKYSKDLMVEKPMALTVNDADLMNEACIKNNCKLFVIKQNRFNVPVIKLREAYQAGRFGKLVLGTVRVRWARPQSYYDQDPWRGTWSMDGGVLTNQASHHIDMLVWFMGDVESVFARTSTALADIEVEDTAVVTVKFKNGALGVIEATTATRPRDLEGSISILGESGSVVIGGFAVNQMQSWAFENVQEGDEKVLEGYSVNPPDVYGFGHKAYYDHVIDCVTHGGKNLVDGLQGRKSVELINAIYESAESGKEVYINSNLKGSKLGQR